MKKLFATAVPALVLAVSVSAGVPGCAARVATKAPGDDVLKARVEAALAGATDVDAARITVEARRGVVTVAGQVTNGFEQQSLGAVVRAVPGVDTVSFSLTIDDPGGHP